MSMSTPTDFAEIIDRAAQQPWKQLRDSVLGHQESFEELAEVWEECKNPGWDGHNALPVAQDTLRGTYLLIESLPLAFPRPAIGAEPDGQLTLEWRNSASRMLSVSIDPDGFLHYAGLFGAGKQYGSLVFFGTAPRELLQLVRSL